MEDEILAVQTFLNKHSGGQEWLYMPWDSVKNSLEQKANNPLCLIAIESTTHAGIDPYFGLPYHKYYYFVQSDKPRNSVNNFLSKTGRNIGPLLKEKSDGKIDIINYVPKVSFTKSTRVFEAVARPPVVHGKVSLKLEATLTPLNTVFASVEGIGIDSNDGLTLKAHGLFENIMADFTLALDSDTTEHFALGVKSSILLDSNGDGHFTTNIKWLPPVWPGSVARIKSEGKFTGDSEVSFQETRWKIEYALGYEAVVDLSAEKPQNLNEIMIISDSKSKAPCR